MVFYYHAIPGTSYLQKPVHKYQEPVFKPSHFHSCNLMQGCEAILPLDHFGGPAVLCLETPRTPHGNGSELQLIALSKKIAPYRIDFLFLYR